MSKKLSIAVMGLFFTVLYFGMNYYVYRSILRGLEVSEGILWILRGLFVVLASFFIFGMFLRKKPHIRNIAFIGYFWLGLLSIAISVFLLRDLAFLLLDFDLGFSTMIAFAITAVTVLYSFYNGRKAPLVREITIPSSKIQHPSEGFTVTQLSDVHLGMTVPKKWLQKIVKKTNELNSDLIVITGDLIDDKFNNIKDFIPVLKELKAPMGKFTIIGNHEIYSGLKDYHQFVEQSGLTLLRNQKVTISKELEVYGVDDVTVEKYLGTPINLEEILKDTDPNRFSLLLFHQPVRFSQSVDLGVDLQLSGHTHNGQIPPLEWIILFYFRYSKGLYKKQDAHIYTSPGTGVWGPPMRFLTKNEITKFHIVPK